MTTMAVAPASLALGSNLSFRPVRMMAGPLAMTLATSSVDAVGGYPDDLGKLVAKSFDSLQRGQRYFDSNGSPTPQFQQFWQKFKEGLTSSLGALETGQVNLTALVQGLLETQKALGEVRQAQVQAETTIAAQNDLQRVRDSYSDANVLTSENVGGSVTVSIKAHNRHYLDPSSSVAVGAGTITGLAAATSYFVFYDDPDLTGGAVTYQATTDNAGAVASLSNPYRHAVGSIATPATTGAGTTGPSNLPSWRLSDPNEVLQ